MTIPSARSSFAVVSAVVITLAGAGCTAIDTATDAASGTSSETASDTRAVAPELAGLEYRAGHLPRPEEIPRSYLERAGAYPLDRCREETDETGAVSGIFCVGGEAPRSDETAAGANTWWGVGFLTPEYREFVEERASVREVEHRDGWDVYIDDADPGFCMEVWLREGREHSFMMNTSACPDSARSPEERLAQTQTLAEPVDILLGRD